MECVKLNLETFFLFFFSHEKKGENQDFGKLYYQHPN